MLVYTYSYTKGDAKILMLLLHMKFNTAKTDRTLVNLQIQMKILLITVNQLLFARENFTKFARALISITNISSPELREIFVWVTKRL